jgi:hypothetical protein
MGVLPGFNYSYTQWANGEENVMSCLRVRAMMPSLAIVSFVVDLKGISSCLLED